MLKYNQHRKFIVFRKLSIKPIKPNTRNVSSSSIDPQDVENFNNIADWWDLNGSLKPLHALNNIRIPFIVKGLISTGVTDPNLSNTSESLKGVKLLEVGCGGGILAEGLARTHATVTGLDPGENLINIARRHLEETSFKLTDRITYLTETIENHSLTNKEKYDGVVVSEVVEHVNEKVKFLEACTNTLKPGGSIFITTFNKTFLSWLTGVIIAENVLNIIPKGTHDWDKFIGPSETQRILEEFQCRTIIVNGFTYDVLRGEFLFIPTTQISYALQAVKLVH